MGDYNDNKAVSNHIWEALFQTNEHPVDSMAKQANQEQEPLPKLHKDWFSPSDLQQRQSHHIDDEARRRVKDLSTDQDI